MLATVGDGDRRRITRSGGLTRTSPGGSIGLPLRFEEVHMAGYDAQANHDARAIWWIFGLVGLLSIAAGVIVLVEPGISLVTLAVVTGIYFLIDGIFEIARAIMGATPSRGLLALLGAVSAIAGVILIRHPIQGVVAIALLVGLWLLTIGIVHFVRAFEDAEHRWMNIGIAVIEAIAGIVIVASPGIGVATLALLVGISLILRGIALCALAWAARSVLHGHGHGAAPTSAAPA
jgi:uncharacterized membrane protein HdeD (DUF308 family)